MGFCIYANIAVAAADALSRFELDRVLIVDFDVHHGNGTQEIFYDTSRVGFLSIHRYPFYPGTGARDETGTGDGLGSIGEHPPAPRHAAGRLSRRLPLGAGAAGRPRPARARPDQRGLRRPRRGPGRRPRPRGRGLRDPDPRDRRRRRDPRIGPDRERARGGLQRPDPGRLRRRPPRRAGCRARADLTGRRRGPIDSAVAHQQASGMTPTGFEPVLHA